MIDIAQYDKTYSESTFKSKVDNMIVMLYTSIMFEDLARVDHFIGDEMYLKYKERILELQKNNYRQMYDELNVKSTEIVGVDVVENKIIVKVLAVVRYMDYIIDKLSGNVISGNNTSRVEKENYLIVEKKINAKELEISRECLACGANMDINYSGKCEYCGSIFNIEDYDWIVTNIES